MKVPTERAAERLPNRLPKYPSNVHALDFAAGHAPDRRAFSCEGRAVTYAELARAVGGMADRLASLGARGSRA